MLKLRTPLLVGLLVIVGAAAFLFTFGSLDQGVDLDGSYEVQGVFDDATGLVINSRVMLSGIPVGAITAIDLDTDDPSKARVTLAIQKGVALHEGIYDAEKDYWMNGATATRLQASLLGDYYIGVTPGVAGEKLAGGGLIRNTIAESGLGAVIKQLEDSTEEIFPKLDKIVTDISAITGSVRQNFADEEGTKALHDIRENVRRTTEEVAKLSIEVRTFVNESVTTRGDQVDRIIGNIERTTAELRDASMNANKKIDGILDNVDDITGDVKGFVGEQVKGEASAKEGTVAHVLMGVDKSVAHLESTLENAKSISGRIDSGEGTIGRLVTDSALIDSVEQVVDDISEFTRGLARLQVKVDFRSEYHIGQASLKSYVSAKIYPKPDKYYFFQVVADPAGSVGRKRRVTTSNDPTKPPVLIEDIVTTEASMKFTLQFAKRWHFLTFRYGVMESTGGIGVDLDLLEDALRFKLDLFDFGRDAWPRLRILAAWEFVRHIYVAGGVDNVLNGASRDYFVGLGVTFTDDDLKAILPFAPSP